MSTPSWAKPYIDNINSLTGTGYNYFYFYDKVYSGGSWAWLDPTNYSFYDDDDNFNNGSFSMAFIVTNNINIHIDSYNDTYRLTFSQGNDLTTRLDYFTWTPATNGTLHTPHCLYPYSYQGSDYLRFTSGSANPQSVRIARNRITGTIEALLSDCTKYYRNCKIYVDGEEWNTDVNYTWSSVPSISGRNGLLRLTQLNSTTDGSPVTNGSASDFYDQPSQADIKRLNPNITYGVNKIVAYSGDKNSLGLKWTDSTHFTIEFNIYNQIGTYDTIAFSYSMTSASTTPKLMLLIDLTGDTPLMRPSVVFIDGSTYQYNLETVTDAQAEELYTWFLSGMTVDDDPVFGEPNHEAGGEGSTILTDEPVGHGGMPNHSAIDMVKLYSLSGEEMADLMTWMDDDDIQITAKWFNGDPLQGIIGACLSPINFESQDTGIASTIKIFGYDTEVSAFRFSTQFVAIDCGEYTFSSQMGDTYLDYNPFTKIKVYLPFIGTLELNTDDVMKRTIKLRYVFDLLYGVCVAQILVNGDEGYSCHYERVGQFLTQLPFSKGDYDSMSSALKQGIATIVGMIGNGVAGGLSGQSSPTGNIAGGTAGGLTALALNVATSHPNVIYNGGSPTGLSGFMGVEAPYILIETPKLARPEKDAEYVGMPSYITDKVKNFSEYTKFKEVHLEGFACTGNERERIMDYLRKGVLIRSGSSTPTDTPQSGGQLIIFLRNLSETNVIGKTFASSSGSTIKTVLEGKLILNQSIETPKFLVEGNVLSYNYAYIPMFNRFYYITDIVLKEQTMMEVSFDVDVLQSFKSSIGECYGIAERSYDRTNYYINDGSLTVQQDTRVITQLFKKSGANFSFSRETDCKFIVTVSSFK